MRNSSISDKERLQHILEAINNIFSFIENISEDVFLEDIMIQSAVLFQFSVIGEAVVCLSNNILEKYSYPWYQVKSFRNFILHEYHAIEMWIVWETIQNNLHELKIIIETILNKEFNN
jgi:uncharacterized protein with HEPN domain